MFWVIFVVFVVLAIIISLIGWTVFLSVIAGIIAIPIVIYLVNMVREANRKKRKRTEAKQAEKDNQLKEEMLKEKREQERELVYEKGNYESLRCLLYNNIEQLLYRCDSIIITTYIDDDGIEEILLKLNAETISSSGLVQNFWDHINLLKLTDEFLEHSELMQIYSNLKPTAPNDKYIREKVLEMYNGFYKNDFSESFSLNIKNSIDDILEMLKNKPIFDQNIELYSKNIFHKIPDNLISNYSYDEMLSYLDNPEFRSKAQLHDYANEVNRSLYIALAKIISKNYDIKELLNLIRNCSLSIENLNESQELYEMEQERKRLLSGDMDYENNLKSMKFDLSTIITGADFERFLSDIFSELGYDVIQTKGSGDKGADLILMKDKAKHVIQAKFHSKPVGNKAVQEAHTAKDIYSADKAAVITNNYFTKQATTDAKAVGVILVNGGKLNALIDAAAQGKVLDIFN